MRKYVWSKYDHKIYNKADWLESLDEPDSHVELRYPTWLSFVVTELRYERKMAISESGKLWAISNDYLCERENDQWVRSEMLARNLTDDVVADWRLEYLIL